MINPLNCVSILRSFQLKEFISKDRLLLKHRSVRFYYEGQFSQ